MASSRVRWVVSGCLGAALVAGAVVGGVWWRLHVPVGGTLAVGSQGGPSVQLVRAFNGATFERPVGAVWAPGGADAYVIEQAGRVVRIPPGGAPEPFLDLSPRVSRGHNEEGLLGLAFHPDYAANGRLFVDYSAADPRRSVIAELRRGEDGTVSPASLKALLEVPQPYGNHNGGHLAFGPDGKLYVGLGDGGAGGDPQGNGQDLGTLLGAILRLDVDAPGAGRPYGIPADNPFVGRAGARGEIWAYGLRNPWRFSFDRATGELFAGDVGQWTWEEVDRIERGGNYGWRRTEGFALFDEETPADDPLPPLAAYGRDEGGSITGGFVYRGSAIPELVGWYVYGDFVSQAVWALRRSPQAPTQDAAAAAVHPVAEGVELGKLLKSGIMLASFGEDPAGELYLVGLGGGVYRLAPGR